MQPESGNLVVAVGGAALAHKATSCLWVMLSSDASSGAIDLAPVGLNGTHFGDGAVKCVLVGGFVGCVCAERGGGCCPGARSLSPPPPPPINSPGTAAAAVLGAGDGAAVWV